jgi:hypothetical protein
MATAKTLKPSCSRLPIASSTYKPAALLVMRFMTILSMDQSLAAGHDFFTDLTTVARAVLGHTYVCRVGSVDSSECGIDFAGVLPGQPIPLIDLEVYTEF